MSIEVTLRNTETGETETVELPSDDYAVVACRWTDAQEVIANHLGSRNGIMRLWKANELADQAVEALAAHPSLLLRPADREAPT